MRCLELLRGGEGSRIREGRLTQLGIDFPFQAGGPPGAGQRDHDCGIGDRGDSCDRTPEQTSRRSSALVRPEQPQVDTGEDDGQRDEQPAVLLPHREEDVRLEARTCLEGDMKNRAAIPVSTARRVTAEVRFNAEVIGSSFLLWSMVGSSFIISTAGEHLKTPPPSLWCR